MPAPTRQPDATELIADPLVARELEAAWTDSQSDDPGARHEEGGWIYLDLATGDPSVRRASSGFGSAIDLSAPPPLPGRVIVGKYHTHPNPTADGWDPGPSAADHRVDTIHGVPDLIRADDGIHLSGPASRRGGLAGNPCYPD